MLLLLPQPLSPKQLPEYIAKSATALGFTHYLPLTSRQILHADCVVLPELTAASLTQNPDMIKQVRAELMAAIAPRPMRATRKVYAARANASVRKIRNGSAVEALLQELGFEKVYFEHMSFLDQINLMQETSVFVGIHGAGMTNMLFLQNEAMIIELLNEENGDLCYFRLASCLGLSYFCMPCTEEDSELANQSDMTVNVELLQKVITAAAH
jgi:capsular polysaccharide biosynthesis protein